MIAVWAVACELVGLFQCSPVRKAWNVSLQGKCIDLSVFFVTQRATNLLTDVVLLALPVRAISGLQTSLAKRISLIFAFTMGGL
jgi:hypothetical protein